jgi:hypothetical protein
LITEEHAERMTHKPELPNTLPYNNMCQGTETHMYLEAGECSGVFLTDMAEQMIAFCHACANLTHRGA